MSSSTEKDEKIFILEERIEKLEIAIKKCMQQLESAAKICLGCDKYRKPNKMRSCKKCKDYFCCDNCFYKEEFVYGAWAGDECDDGWYCEKCYK